MISDVPGAEVIDLIRLYGCRLLSFTCDIIVLVLPAFTYKQLKYFLERRQPLPSFKLIKLTARVTGAGEPDL
jgi:hypothetical protein